MPSVATLSEESAAFAAAREVCRRHAKSFYFASAFLEKSKREAAYAVYAFCRRMDDAIDEVDADELRPPATVGVAYRCLSAEFESDGHDVALDRIITED